MGRGKLNMELITKEKSRMVTYQKRKKGLLKKAKEFSILCDVETCVIMFGPDSKDRSREVDTFPEEPNEVKRITNKFRGKVRDLPRLKSNTLSDFFISRKKKLDEEIFKLRQANLEARFPSWDKHLDALPREQLRALSAAIDTKLQLAKNRLVMLRSERQFLMEDTKLASWAGSNMESAEVYNNQQRPISSSVRLLEMQQPAACYSCINDNKKATNYVDMGVYNNQQQLTSSSVKLVDMQLPASYFSNDQVLQMLGYDHTAVAADSTTMLRMNGGDYIQYGDVDVYRSSNINVASTQHKLAAHYDPLAAMLESVPGYNPNKQIPVCYYAPIIQPTPPCGYGQQTTPNVSSNHHSNASKFLDYLRGMNEE